VTTSIETVVDTDRYPILEPGSDAYTAAVSRAHEELAEDGCMVLPDFVRADLLDELRSQCASVAPLAYYDVEVVNVYNTATDSSLPQRHPVNTTMERGNAFVARDQVPTQFMISRLYTSPEFQRFIAACVGLPEVFELADPLAGLCINVLTEGRSHPWHFDTNEFAISMLTQAPLGGGSFEYCPEIRSADAENFADVGAVLAGGGEHLVRRLDLRPGDLQLFLGRYSLHRVTAVQGARERHSAIFAYSARSGVVGTVPRTKQLFGRVLPQHLAAAGRAGRSDSLLD
jgi:hypothetical protein